MFPTNSSPLYEFQLMVTVTEKKKAGSESLSFTTGLEKFAVLGGSKRTIRRGGENGIADADIMSEFYQAKHFHNLVVTKQVNSASLIFQRIFDHQLSFGFTLTVKSLEPQSRFRSIRLVTRKARITKPPTTSDEGVTLNIKYSDPEVFHGSADSSSSVVEEKI
jgi:hypothetical protein